jgi:soluble lytic murein transglycosylase-like protein
MERRTVITAFFLLLLSSCVPQSVYHQEKGEIGGREEKKVPRKVSLLKEFFLEENPSMDEGLALLYARWVVRAGEKWNVDPVLIVAVITIESRGKPYAISPMQAVGPMQILPEVGKEVAIRYGVPWEGWTTLLDPETNIYLGTAYLGELLRQFGDLKPALAAYNIGPARLKKTFLKNGKGKKVPIQGPYIRQILHLYNRWKMVELTRAKEERDIYGDS